MLLRNLTDKLVNGLLGKVVNISQEHVSVRFTRCDIVADLTRVAFTGNIYFKIVFFTYIMALLNFNNCNKILN